MNKYKAREFSLQIPTKNIEAITLKYIVVNLGTVTTDNTGWKDISSFRPTNIDVLFALFANCQSSIDASVSVRADGTWFMGTPNKSYKNVEVRYYYIK